MSGTLTEINKLRNFEQNLEKTHNAAIDYLSELDESQTIKDIKKEINNSRETLKDKIHKEMEQIFNPLQKIKDLLHQENIENIDLSLLKNEMLTIQQNIQTLKKNAQVPLDTLKKEEERLNDDIAALENKMQQWNKPSVVNSFKKKINKPKNKLETKVSVCEEATDFMDFLIESGGHENGWHIDDHNLFLRVRSKTKDPKRIAEFVHEKLPDISEQQIMQHEMWFRSYIKLRDKQKQAIKRWRKDKIEEQKRINMFPQFSKSPERRSGDKCTLGEKRLKLLAWKTAKREQEEFKYGLLKEEQRRSFLKEQEDRKKSIAVKAAIQSWKERKQAMIEAEKKEQELLEKEEMERRAAKANKLIKEYQQQDKMLLKKRLESQKRASAPSSKNEANRPHKSVDAVRDPERLYKLKKHWLVGINKKEKKEKHKHHLNTMPKLLKPVWRRGLV